MKDRGASLFLVLAAMFIAALVTSNLIFQKFFTWSPFGDYVFELSVGILPYPLTFLITDIISEIFGKRAANRVVLSGLAASLFTLLIIYVADSAVATDWSPVNNDTFSVVFGLSPLAVAASMIAYLIAQFIDIKIFHFWKKKTRGKHLWIRNNFSTTFSQMTDTFVVLFLLCSFHIIEWERFWLLFVNGFLFKIMFALFDTPIIYLAVWKLRKIFHLREDQDLGF